MITSEALSDSAHPAVRRRAEELTAAEQTALGKARAIFAYVRDGIRFGFPPEWDRVKASETLEHGRGYCNTKATVFHALCRAAGVSSRVHTGLIDLRIMKGIFPSVFFPFLPPAGGHSWMEIEIDGEWRPIDSYINDRPFYEGAVERLRTAGGATGFSVSRAGGPSSCEFNFGEIGFVHMGAVVEDHGVWEDFAQYMACPRYISLRSWQRWAYPLLARMGNRNVDAIRGTR
ncbi:MAG: transglutaminase domain-containing protein [Acidimicrobiia bacterium]|nr:transglutaminase domain-containing protein [Acidimicrobiia bacterium]